MAGRISRALVVTAFLGVIPGCKGHSTDAGATPAPASATSLAKPEPGASSATDHLATARFESAPTKVGAKIHGVRSTSLKLSVEFWQEGEKLGTNDSTRNEDYSRTVEVLGLVGSAPGKVSAHYDQYRFSETRSDQPASEGAALQGKTYVLDATDGKMRITTPDGKAPTPAEDAALEPLHLDLGKDDPVVTRLGTQPISVGQSFPMSDGLFRALFGAGKEQGEFKSGTITLAKVENVDQRPAATFHWSAEMTTDEENGLEIAWHLTGNTVVLESPAQTLSTSITGSLDASGHTTQKGAKVDLAGAGTLKDERTNTPW